MSRTIVDIHVLQSVPPSNVNRDDTGSPKTATYGGVRRARVSSQAWKRATRLAFNSSLSQDDLGVRTKRIVEIVVTKVHQLRPDLDDVAPELAEGVLKATGIGLEKVARKKQGELVADQPESKYLVFLSHLQVNQLAEKVIEIADASDSAEALKAFKGKDLLNRGHSIDLSLFGRMVADVTDLNVDAAAQVAHAISVHAVDNEFDYFTAVDDEKRGSKGEDAGAGMIGTVEFNSSTLYRYATVDVDALHRNLGDVEATSRAVSAFIHAFVTSMPTGKQNTFANRTLPDAVVVTVRDSQPVNLIGAFEDAVVTEEGRTRAEVAAARLGERAAALAEAYGENPIATWGLAVGQAKVGLATWGESLTWTTLPTLPGAVAELAAARLQDS